MPPAGQVAVLTNANGRLANRFRDIVAPYFDPFYSKKIVNDYSGAFKNPYWGTYGATVFFGGRHAAIVATACDRCTTALVVSGTEPWPAGPRAIRSMPLGIFSTVWICA